jgi:uncharacterized protein YdhG (YjbR/CyaY superfamily)
MARGDAGSAAVDAYIAGVDPAKRDALERIRRLAKKAVPEAVETISYRMPTLTYRGKAFLGFDAHTKHIGIYPYDGSVIEALRETLRDYETSKGAIRVPLDTPIPERTLHAIIACRLRAIRAGEKHRLRT